MAIGQSAVERQNNWFVRHQGLLIGPAVVIALLLASAWLVLPYLKQGRVILSGVGSRTQQERQLRANDLGQFLSRAADGPGEASVDVLYATPTYFEVAGKAEKVGEYRPDRFLIFVVMENIHVGALPRQAPTATLLVDGVEYSPADVEGPGIAEHHRGTTVRFSRVDAQGQPVITSETKRLELRIPNIWDDTGGYKSAIWRWPITYPEEFTSSGVWSMTMLLALAAGLLSSVLTPCLLQLVIIYFTTLTGLTMEGLQRTGMVSPALRQKVLKVALAFVIGFMGLYTAAGAVIGYAGQGAQAFFSEWSRPISIGTGVLIIAIGLWVGMRARAPLVCKIPTPGLVKRIDQGGFFRSVLMGAGFSLGCSTCFSGALIATLLIYVGVLGSALTGALVLFMFSLGVGIPFLLAALFLSRVVPWMTRLVRYAPYVGLASTVLMTGFGVILITDNFHVVSNLLYPLLGLG
ncbi:MAG: sulfite exporter TauE/SafE family protein [Deinococcus sp.]|nr:sulfite exporter TauE/SafE family protein [Deinococcus sp.]